MFEANNPGPVRLNRVQLAQLDTLLADGTLFGHSTAETFRPDFTTGARQIQLGMKLSF